jgi:DNA-binding NarL/FixJ family response regulator
MQTRRSAQTDGSGGPGAGWLSLRHHSLRHQRTGSYSCASSLGLQRQSLARLSPEHGEVIDLVYFHGKSVKEVAEIVAIAEATVKTRMFYARKVATA